MVLAGFRANRDEAPPARHGDTVVAHERAHELALAPQDPVAGRRAAHDVAPCFIS